MNKTYKIGQYPIKIENKKLMKDSKNKIKKGKD